MSLCRAFLIACSRSFSRPHNARATPIALQLHFSRTLFTTINPLPLDTSPAASSSTTIEQHVEGLTTTNDIPTIHTHYTTLVAKLKDSEKYSSFPTHKILTESQLHKILWLLAKSGRPSDIQRIYDILLDMPLVFGVNLTPGAHTSIIRGLLYRGEINSTRRWLEGMPKRPGNFTPTLEQYHLFLEMLPSMDGTTLKLMRSIVNKMRSSGCKPTNETFKFLFMGRMKLGDQTGSLLYPISMSAVLEDMEREGVPYDASFGELLIEEYTKRGQARIGEQVLAMYEDKFRTQDYEGRQGMAAADLKLVQMAQARGMHSAIQFFRYWKPKQKPSPENITSMLRHSLRLRDLQLLEREFGVKCTVKHWSLLINSNVRVGNARTAYEIYNAAKEAGIIPDTPMVAPLIRFMCQPRPDPSEDETFLGFALRLYDDLRMAFPPKETAQLEEQSTGPDYAIYATLLRGLATCVQSHKYMDVVMELMDDMAKRNLVPDDSAMVTSFIILHMRNSPTLEDALRIYRQHKAGLDENGYAAVLNTFCKLRFGKSVEIPSLKGYFEIVKDMRHGGVNITIEVYTILLSELGLLATQVLKNGGEGAASTLNKLTLTTRRAHDLLTLDASLSPDTILWNQMMNTYQRLECFADAYRIWEMMFLSGQFDQTSVSIILDACGFAGAYPIAQKIITKLSRDSYQFSTHNLNTWLECLCRLGRLDEAISSLCGEGEEPFSDVKPDVESVKIVFKFAKGEKREMDVLVRVRTRLPHVWSELPASIRELI